MVKSEMPKMVPVPIETKGQPWYIQIKRWLFKSREWEIVEDWQFTLPNGVVITIPAGFQFDGASVPRFAWVLLSPVDILFIPSLIHDHGYRKGFLWATSDKGVRYKYGTMMAREGWDALFYLVCQQVNGMKTVSHIAWGVLSIFGFFSWNKNESMRIQNGLL